MTSAVEQLDRIAPSSRELGARLGDPEWLATLRAEAADSAERMSFPDSRRERPWKYLDVSDLNLALYQPGAPATAGGAAGDLRNRYGLPAGGAALIQENSETILAESLPGEVTVSHFGAAEGTAEATIRQRLASVVSPRTSKFTALHYAYLAGGVLVHVPANSEVPAPVRIVRNYTEAGQVAAPHTLIVTGANSRVTIIEDFRSGDGDILILPAVEVVPGPGAQVRYITLHRWGANTRVFSEQRLTTDRDSAFVGLNIVIGGKVVKGHITSSLEGRGSSSELLGISLGSDAEQIDFYTLQDHIGADTRSDLLYKSALRGTSRSVYYGLTRVGLGARNADANQENRNLLLSKTAKADSDPVLEILTNDVIRVSHGATAGPVDEEQIFYLQARGIRAADAEAMLVRAFVGAVLARIPSEELRDELTAIVDQKLERA